MSATRHWEDIALLMGTLEDCAAGEKPVISLNSRHAQTLLDEIYQLRLGRNVTIELSGGRTHATVPPAPDREGQQFEDRDGSVWTWASFSQHPGAWSGPPAQLVREVDGGEDEILPWADAWREHGPLWLLPNVAATGQLVLRTQMVVNGRRWQVRAAVDEFYWDHYGGDYWSHMKADLRRRLVDAIAAELDPPVSVQRKPKWIRKREAQQRDRYVPPDAPVDENATGAPR